MGSISGNNACIISFTAVGAAAGGLGAIPGLLGGAAVGYLCGRLVCKFKCFQDWFDNKIDGKTLDTLLNEEALHDEVVGSLSSEVSISSKNANDLLTVLVQAMKANKKDISQSKEFALAEHHPATGNAQHGISNIKQIIT